ncbi:hypothetical protein H4R21_001715 [Coemansia helicoidea]|uniref:Uncharacterized protein n=1 Tax=Coemansia helicoidea TaxID=1286919 RepID=A0ACC1LAY4_9FUNG|nr:hypothetical protein H4R21_001715 [Coemansia helicoidea]
MAIVTAQDLVDKADTLSLQESSGGVGQEPAGTTAEAHSEPPSEIWERVIKDIGVAQYKRFTELFGKLDVGDNSDPRPAQDEYADMQDCLVNAMEEIDELKEQVAALTAKLAAAQEIALNEQRARETAQLMDEIARLKKECMPTRHWRERVGALELLSERHKVHIRSLQSALARERGY